ncbi:uncharacterized protein LOC128339825 [Hemicordylus capensis]|uniref:uncharacterized protein LOC128339825 n=1 Tax=Hemicordylus capensis TaxID=884348 RepID=UPI0023026A90|nr:uncharacterized protein LOC128339825 [Hemicordylus capensis]
MAQNQKEGKLQTSFPPVHFSLGTFFRSMEETSKDHISNLHVSRHIQGPKINLSQVESLAATEKGRVTRDYNHYLGPCLSPLNASFPDKREIKLDNGSVSLSSLKAASVRPSAVISRASDCPNCKKERRIRGEYDKFILQARRDKEALQKRIARLEADLRRHEEHQKSTRVEDKAVGCSMTFLVEMEAHLERTPNTERTQTQQTEVNQSKMVSEMEELKALLEKAKEQEEEKTTHLEIEKEACLEEIAQLKKCIEKVRVQNDALLEKVKMLQKALINQSPSWKLCSTALNTEVLTISHSDTAGAGFPEIIPAYSQYDDDAGATYGSSKANGKYVDGTILMKHDAKDTYKQLERERNLLLDVMVIMYTRRWFLEEAIPYIRRTLKKCGISSEHGK